MGFDMNTIIENMVNSAHEVVSDDAGEIGSYVNKIIKSQKVSLEELSVALIAGEITTDEFEEELSREKKVVEAEFLAVKVMSKATVEKAVNAAMETLQKAVFALI